MKKTTLAIALMVSMGGVQGASYDLTGTFYMYDPAGSLLANDPLFLSSLELDMTTGAGTRAGTAAAAPRSAALAAGQLWPTATGATWARAARSARTSGPTPCVTVTTPTARSGSRT